VLDTPSLDLGVDYVAGGPLISFSNSTASTAPAGFTIADFPAPQFADTRTGISTLINNSFVRRLPDDFDFTDRSDRTVGGTAIDNGIFLESDAFLPGELSQDIVLDISVAGSSNGFGLANIASAAIVEVELPLIPQSVTLSTVERDQLQNLQLNVRDVPSLVRAEGLTGSYFYQDYAPDQVTRSSPTQPPHRPTTSVVTIDRIADRNVRRLLTHLDELEGREGDVMPLQDLVVLVERRVNELPDKGAAPDDVARGVIDSLANDDPIVIRTIDALRQTLDDLRTIGISSGEYAAAREAFIRNIVLGGIRDPRSMSLWKEILNLDSQGESEHVDVEGPTPPA